jgi:7-cyano-7-deazaguanine synthase
MKKGSKNIGVLFSGGLDSAALIGFLLNKGYSVWPVYTQAGLHWEKIEYFWAQKFLKAQHSARLHKLASVRLALEQAYHNNWSHTGETPGEHSRDESVYLPARNLLLITKALLYLSSQNIYQLAIATLRGNPFPDGRVSYFKLLEKVLAKSFNQNVRILTPFRQLHKKDIIARCFGVPIHYSFSCINPIGRFHCGRCNKCAERKRAFTQAGVNDKTIYARG